MKQRKDGRYETKVYLGKVDGKPKYKSVMGNSPAEVNKKAAELRVLLGQGVNVLSDKAFENICDAWLRKFSRSATPEWYHTVEPRAKIWREYFEGVPIDKINPIDIEEAINEFAECNPYYNKPTSRKTLKEYLNVISRIFDFCLENRILTFNPSNYVTLPKSANKGKREPITEDEIKIIWKTEGLMQLPCLVMIYAGLRKGEMIALTWNDIDFKNNTISVNKSANLKDGGNIKCPKTEAGYRTIPMPKVLADYLKGIKKDGITVLNRDGEPFNRNGLWEWEWEKYMRKCGIDTTAHCLRHTYCSILYAAGVDALTAKEYMGHSDIQTTLGIYTHLMESSKLGQIEKLDKYLSPSIFGKYSAETP